MWDYNKIPVDKWNKTFEGIRSLNYVHQLFCFSVAVYCIIWSVTSWSFFGLTVERRSALLHFVLFSGTLAEINMWLGHTWIMKPGRKLPLWCISETLGKFFFNHPLCNASLTLITIIALIGCFFSSQFILVALISLLCTSVVDLWRLLYIHYWLAALFGLLMPNPQLSMALIFASLYAWAGFFKLTSAAFYKHTASFVFGPLFSFIGAVLCIKPRPAGNGHTSPLPPKMRYILSGSGVGIEMLMGLAFLVPWLLPSWHLFGVVLFNVFFHLYIVIMIGWANGIETFISWNFMCMAVSALLFTDQDFIGKWPVDIGWHHYCLLLVLHVPAVLQLFGLNEYGTLSHSWFVPGVGGVSTLLFPASCLANIPREDNGLPVEVYMDEDVLDKIARILGGYDKVAKALKLDDLQEEATGKLTQEESKMAGVRAMHVRQMLVENCICMTGAWVDGTLRLQTDTHDTCNECFGAGPLSFWKTITHVVIKAPAIRLLDHRGALFGKPKPLANLIT
eukprot:TRINITY_DN17067_c0_g1_i1.p1 TRINITY_DN17067_c0_g1~~TRINITY_DN17067_c0_g1_i1.p1  ORF type:complete len:506 (-),score=32.20 TRINITY_DN17067_c0_g1_i1:207-1724(-)